MRVLITGVGREGQMGQALADAFARDGARLALVDRTPANVEARAAEVRAAGGEAHAFACDLADPDAVAAMVESLRKTLGDVDAVVCAAGGFAMTGAIDEGSVADWERQIAINLTTAHLTTRATLPMLRRTRGAIVYFTSAAALPGASAKGKAAYVAAKSGVLALMHAVAEDERHGGVRANAVAPTAIRTAANVADMGADAAYVEREDVAAVIRWLCSAAARSVTGQVIRL